MAVYSDDWLKYIIAFMNSKIVSTVFIPTISQTININAGDIEKLPIILSDKEKSIITQIADENIQLCKTDWDSFETSWDFKKHPLV